MKRLKTLLPFNYLHYYALSVLIALISYERFYFLLLYIPFCFLIKRYQSKKKVLLLGIFFFIILVITNYLPKQLPDSSNFIITERKEGNDYYTYIVKQKSRKYLFYEKEYLNIGDVLEIDFEQTTFTKEKVPGGFNQKKYYNSLRIFYKLNVKEFKVVNNKFTISKIKYYCLSLFDDYPEEARLYIKTLIFADNDFEGDFKKALSKVGISHLFALSGLHLTILVSMLERALSRFNKKTIIIITILTIYGIIIAFPISLKRAYLMYLLMRIFKEESITALDAISLSFLIMLINPYLRYNYSFILSFLVSFFIILIDANYFKMSLIAFLVSIPFLINFNGGLLIISLPISLLISYLFSVFILPLVVLSLIKIIAPMSNYLLTSFNEFVTYVSKGTFIKIHYLSLTSIIIYLFLLVFLLLGKNNKLIVKRSFYIGLFMLIAYLYPFLNPQGYLYFLDVNQGDATFISRPFNKANILIDCNKGTYDFLSTQGAIEIDYLFITHGDLDHSADLLLILANFKVHNLYLNSYDRSGLKEKLHEYNLLSAVNDEFVCGDVIIKVFGPEKDYFNDNDNSLVLKVMMDGQSYLFTGDSGFKREKDLVKYGSDLKSDYLHVSHHGANNSTSLEFLRVVKPDVAIISYGLNYYNHPHPETLDRLALENIKVLKTKESQTIIIRKYNFRSLTNSFVIQKESFSV